MMICFIKDNIPIYEYCPFDLNEKEIEKWENSLLSKYTSDEWFKNIYWKLEKISCPALVHEDRSLVESIVGILFRNIHVFLQEFFVFPENRAFQEHIFFLCPELVGICDKYIVFLGFSNVLVHQAR